MRLPIPPLVLIARSSAALSLSQLRPTRNPVPPAFATFTPFVYPSSRRGTFHAPLCVPFGHRPAPLLHVGPMSRFLGVFILLTAAGTAVALNSCRRSETQAPPAASTPSVSALAELLSAAPAAEPTPSDDEPAPVESAQAAASAEPAASQEPADSPAPAAADQDAPLPNVKVSNIGMHIGGGPNDNATKAPIRDSVKPHYDEFRRCFALASEPTKEGDFGVDLRIPRAGGKAGVSHPRTAIKGQGFKECMVAVFEGIDFQKPKRGDTTVSYSLRFTPISQ